MIKNLWKLWTALLLAGCSYAPPAAEARTEPISPVPTAGQAAQRPAGKDVRLATWNVRNFFDTVDDKYEDEVLSVVEFRDKLYQLKLVVEQLDADFLALEEVENMECLRSLNDTLVSPYPQRGLLEGNDRQRGIDVAFLSRVPVKSVVSHAADSLPEVDGVPPRYKFSRDCLEVTLDTDPPVKVLVNHFKSARGDAKKSAAKRRAQAERVAAIVEEVDDPKSTAVVVLGDLNDVAGSWSLEPLFASMKDALKDIPEKERITHRFKSGGTGIDHVLLDEDARKISAGAKIWRELAAKTSDHNPVSLQINLTVKGEAQNRVWE